MEYKWDIRELEKLKRYYQYLLRDKNRTKAEKVSIKEKISFLKEMKEITKIGHPKESLISHVKYEDKQKILPLSTLEYYDEIHPKLKRIMVEAMQSLKGMEDTYNNIEFPSINLTDKELVDMSLDFACWLPDKNIKKRFSTF